MPSATPVHDATLLGAYARRGAFTDCYETTVSGTVSLPELIEAFYTTPLLKVERWILAKVVSRPSTDPQAHALLGFHRLYSMLLLSAAARRVVFNRGSRAAA
jgi:hypothetical protein